MSDMEPRSQFLVYRDEEGNARIDVRFDGDTVWLTQVQLAELFDTSQQNISLHVQHVHEEGELPEAGTHKDYLSVRREGSRDVRRSLTHYNLDMIISVGYRVRSRTATAFRIWATQQLREFIVKGFVLDDDRLKNPDLPFDYFDELLQRIQDIRTSERRFYEKITDVYATSADYEADVEITRTFFAKVQNKLHWAITGQTAAEVVRERADARRPTWASPPGGAATSASPISRSRRTTTPPTSSARSTTWSSSTWCSEGQARRRIPMRMADWITKLDGFLTLNDRDVLTYAGKVSHDLAVEHANAEFEKYRQRESPAVESDFDRFTRRVLEEGPNDG